MFKRILIGSMAALALAATASAKEQAAAAPAELAQYDFFLGTWHCSGKALASPMAPEHATTATVHVTKAVGGRWLHVTYDENKTAANATPYHAGLYWGYDSGKKTFVQRCFDVMGGYCAQTSAGWKGDTFAFEGTGDGDQGEFGARDTLVKKGAGEMTHSGEMQGPDKKWIKTDEETCRKGK